MNNTMHQRWYVDISEDSKRKGELYNICRSISGFKYFRWRDEQTHIESTLFFFNGSNYILKPCFRFHHGILYVLLRNCLNGPNKIYKILFHCVTYYNFSLHTFRQFRHFTHFMCKYLVIQFTSLCLYVGDKITTRKSKPNIFFFKF